jgi:rhamnosyl/mannosyltransferase
MRILHFYKNALPETVGGVEQVMDQIARGTGALGIQNTILALSNSPSDHPTPKHGYELITAKRNFELASNGFSWQSISLFKDLAAKADLIHYHFPWPFADLVHQLAAPKKPTVLTYHSDIIRQKLLLQLYRPLKHQFLKSIDHIVATSPNYLQNSGVLQTFADKASVIPIGLDDQTYPKPDASIIKFYKEHFGERFFLFIGAFRYYKGLKFLIEAAREAPYPIVIVGLGPIEDELKADAQRYQLNNVFFLGQTSEENKSALLEACYGVIFPSHLRSEAFGVTLLEGAMFGKPLISCEIGTGTTYVNIDQETGLATPPSDPKALANAMSWLWTHSEEAKEMGQRARARYEALFTAKQMAQSYFELYQKLLNR